MEISSTGRVRNEGLLHTVKEERNIKHTIRKRRLTGLVTSCVGIYLLKHATKDIGKERRDRKTEKKAYTAIG
jgi:hypothetical protein